jgi:hypothetical protein
MYIYIDKHLEYLISAIHMGQFSAEHAFFAKLCEGQYCEFIGELS